MRRIQFWKVNGAGNDFLIIDNMEQAIPPELFPHLARTLCRRRLSVGGDGLMVVEPAEAGGDFRMRFYNADGSAGEMCGNGARCICRYGYEKGLAGEVQRVETPSGMVTGYRISRRDYRIRLTAPSVIRLSCPCQALGRQFDCAYIELGRPGLPHAVVPIPALGQEDPRRLQPLGAALRSHENFPKGANVNFYDITGKDQLQLLTYERGVEDFTCACGTGSASTVLALTRMGKVSGRDVAVSSRGGTLFVTVERPQEEHPALWLTGPTNVVCRGEITDDELTTAVCPPQGAEV